MRRRGKAEREARDGPTNQMHRRPQANTSSSLGAHPPLPGFDPQVNLAVAGRAPRTSPSGPSPGGEALAVLGGSSPLGPEPRTPLRRL